MSREKETNNPTFVKKPRDSLKSIEINTVYVIKIFFRHMRILLNNFSLEVVNNSSGNS